MVEYLKELQAEKESLESMQDKGKATNAIKLIEQGKTATMMLFLFFIGITHKDPSDVIETACVHQLTIASTQIRDDHQHLQSCLDIETIVS